MTIKVSDYIFRHLADEGVRHVFLITGGGAMHLNDSLGREKRIEYICNHHEQGCAIAADGYARIRGDLSVVSVTTGPGGTNALTGVVCQWQDSIPGLYISGQVRYDTTVEYMNLPLRQFGDQELDIVRMVKGITKYAVMVTDPLTIRYHLEKAIYLARSGRPGPCWVDVPLNVQAAMVEEDQLKPYDPGEDRILINQQKVEEQVAHVLERIRAAQRPVLLGGSAIRLSGSFALFHEVINLLGIPVQTAWNADDLLPTDHPLFFGRPSTIGQRGANFIFQNSDLLLSLGCRLNIRQIGYTFPSIARGAFKIVVDIDAAELKKPTIRIDYPVQCDAKVFLEEMKRQLAGRAIPPKTDWMTWGNARLAKYPVVLPEYRQSDELDRVNPYVFCDEISNFFEDGDVVMSSDAASAVVPQQVLRYKPGMRHVANSGCAPMGHGLPAAVGACVAREGGRVFCFEGDGSIQLNIQELQTIAHHKWPLKIFVFNNGGYLSIRTTQKNFFAGNLVGESTVSGVSFPDMVKVASAYGLTTFLIRKHSEIKEVIEKVLATTGPVLCDVRMKPEQEFMPRVTSQRLPDGKMVSKPLEDMFPFLDRDEFLSNMLIPPWEG